MKTKKSANIFDTPMMEMPNFDMPKMEVPAAFREFAEKSVSQAKDNWEKMKAVTEDATDMIETSYSTASKGASDYGLALIDAARANTNATFDFYSQIMTAKSLSEMIELSTSHARKQFETVTAQSKDLTALAQKVATESDRADQVRHDHGLQESRLKSVSVSSQTSTKPGPVGPGFFLSGIRLEPRSGLRRTGGAGLLAKAGTKTLVSAPSSPGPQAGLGRCSCSSVG